MSDRDQAPNPWADFLRAQAQLRGWSLTRLAREAGIHKGTLFRWLHGKIRDPDLESVRLIAVAVGADMASALRAAGQLTDDAAIDETDWEIRMIRGSGLRQELVEQLVAGAWARRKRERANRREELEEQIALLRASTID